MSVYPATTFVFYYNHCAVMFFIRWPVNEMWVVFSQQQLQEIEKEYEPFRHFGSSDLPVETELDQVQLSGPAIFIFLRAICVVRSNRTYHPDLPVQPYFKSPVICSYPDKSLHLTLVVSYIADQQSVAVLFNQADSADLSREPDKPSVVLRGPPDFIVDLVEGMVASRDLLLPPDV